MSRTPEQILQPITNAYAGIDAGKTSLDFYISPVGVRLQVNNDKTGVKSLARHCARHGVKLLALEATGKFHRLAHEMLHDTGVPVAVVNPFRSRQFADSMGRLAKSDTIDAEVLAAFAERMTPQPTLPPSARHKALRELHTARRQTVDEAADLKRQLQTTDHPLAAEQIRQRITLVEGHKAALEQEIYAIVAVDPDMSRKLKILMSIPGIGKITATLLISDLWELGEVNARQIASLAGVAPMNWDSGVKNGNRVVRGGRKSVRNALYMCALSCVSRSGSSGSFYRRLIQRGKNPKVALTAVMRKLVIAANTLIAEDRI